MQPSPRRHQLIDVPWQQASPETPQGEQDPLTHFTEEALQNPTAGSLPQQDCPGPPQASPLASAHEPPVQTPAAPPPVHICPAATHTRGAAGVAPGTQHPPSLQVFGGQQGPPGVPQSAGGW